MKQINYNELSKQIHQQNKDAGWWNGEQCIFTKLQLVSTEIAEATEGERKDLMDDHLTHRKMGEVELADAVIRLLDLGGHLGLTYAETNKNILADWSSLISESSPIAKMHMTLNIVNSRFADDLTFECNKHNLSNLYSLFINLAVKICEIKGYDLYNSMLEKLEYNKQRSDHKLENRAKIGGKSF